MPGHGSRRIYFLFILVNLFLVTTSCEHIFSIQTNSNTPNIVEPQDRATKTARPTIFNSMQSPLSNTKSQVGGFRYPQVPLDVESYPVAPKGLKLEQVHVYVRHGERAPISNRMYLPPANIPEHWLMCHTARRFRAAVSSYMGGSIGNELVPTIPMPNNTKFEETSHSRRVVEDVDGFAREGNCLLGELTDLGRQSTFFFGQNLRRLYVERLGFLPDVLTDTNTVYFRSTNVPRTTESLQQIIHGLYPTHKCLPSARPTIFVRNLKDENLLGNSNACKRLELLLVGFAKAAAEAFNATLEPLDKKLSKYIGGNPIRVDGKPRASGIMDTIRAAIAHGIKVPPEFEDKSITDAIEQAVVNEWFADKTEEVRRLGMGRLLSDLSRKMQAQMTSLGNKDKSKVPNQAQILVHSTHDTALAGLCATLDVFDERWPAFTASITFELFKEASSVSSSTTSSKTTTPLSIFSRFASGGPTSTGADQYYIRTRYQNKSMHLPLCQAPGDHLEGHPEFCTFSAFQRRVAELTPVDWEAECTSAGRK